MATRGAKPKPARLRLIDGTHNVTRHGPKAGLEETADDAIKAFGPLVRPVGLRGHALKAWKKYIEPAAWLDGSKEPAALAFCELWGQFRDAPQMFVAAKHGQLRAYMAELGLTDERNRKPLDDGKGRDEFFDD